MAHSATALFQYRSNTAVKKQFEKIMTVRMTHEEHVILSERSREVGSSFSRYLIECGLFECGMRRGILTTDDCHVLQFVAFQVAKAGTNLNQIAKRLNRPSDTVDLSHLTATLVEIQELSRSLKYLIGEV